MNIIESQKIRGKKFEYTFTEDDLFRLYDKSNLKYTIDISFLNFSDFRRFNKIHPKRQIVARLFYFKNKKFEIFFYPLLAMINDELLNIPPQIIWETIESKLLELQKNDIDNDIRLCFDVRDNKLIFTNKPCYHKKHCSINRRKFKVFDLGFRNPVNRH